MMVRKGFHCVWRIAILMLLSLITMMSIPFRTDAQTGSGLSPLDDLEPAYWDIEDQTTIVSPRADIEGGLLVVLYRTLLYVRFDGEAVFPISPDMASETVYALPSGNVFYRGLAQGTRNVIFILEPSTREATVGFSPHTDGFLLNYNADGSWFAYWDEGLYVMAADSSYQSTSISDDAVGVWLTDNRYLYFESESADSDAAVNYFDPATSLSRPIMKLRDPIDEAILSMEDELLAMGYEYAAEPIPEVTGLSPDGTLRYVIQFPENRSAAGLCDEWQIDSYNRYNGRQETVYAANDTHALSNLNVLDDGSMLFVRWLREDCRLSNPLQLELLRLTPDGELRLVTERISTATSNLSTLTNINRRYTVSNNGRYVVWISGSENDNDNALEIADLHTGKSTSLIRFDVTARLADLRFLSVTWIE